MNQQTAQVHNMPNQNPQNFQDVTQAEVDRQAEEQKNQNVEEVKTEKMSAQKKYEEFLQLPPEEIFDHYENNFENDEWQEFVKAYDEVLEIRDEMTAKMKRLAEFTKDKKLDFPTFKHVHKRATKPKKTQNLIDASFAWVAKKLGGGGYQPGLFSDDDE